MKKGTKEKIKVKSENSKGSKDRNKITNEKKKLNKGKILKRCLLVVLAFFLLFGTKTLVFNYFNNKNPLQEKNNKAVVSIGIFDDGTYFLSKAKPDIKFAIDSNDVNSYKLTDSNNKVVKSKIVKEKGKNYIAPEEKYKLGEIYFLELTNTKFIDKTLKKASKLEFKIEEPEKDEYKFSKDVIQLNKDDIIKLDNNKVKISNAKLKENQIILVKDKDNINNAYKISSLEGDIATIEPPSVSEIYSDIDLYKEGYINFDDIEFNKNIEKNIEKNVKKSSLYKYLTYDVYAKAEEPKIVFKSDGEKVTIEIELNFKPDGEKKLGIEALKKHELTIKMSYEFSIKFQTDIKLGKIIAFDAAISNASSFEIELKNGDEYLKGIEEISDEEYSKSVQEIVQKIQKEVPDVSENSIDIGAIEVPTGVPGLNVYMDIYFQNQLSVLVNINTGVKYETVEHVGFVIDKTGSRAYKNIQDNSFDVFMKVTGKEEIRVGIGMDIGISIINKDLASAGVGAEFGAYQEAFSTYNLEYNSMNNKANRDLIAKLELGVYLKAKVKANIDFLLFKTEVKLDLKEFKYPVLKLGNDEIIKGITSSNPVVVLDEHNRMKIPEITKTLLNLDTERERTEKCDEKSIYFEDSDGNRFRINDNYIEFENVENDMKIYAVYEIDNKKYKTIIHVLKHGENIKNDQGNKTNNNLGITNNQAGCLSINSNSNAINAYKKYVVDKKYTEDYQNYFKEAGTNNPSIYDVGYCIYDINKDNTPELIINAYQDGASKEWLVTIIYTFDGIAAKKIESIYNYSGIRYNPSTAEIVYTELRPTMVISSYGFYKLVNDRFILSKSVGHDRGYYNVYTGEYEYNKFYYSDSNTNLKEITESEEKSYFDNIVSFSYQDISQVN